MLLIHDEVYEFPPSRSIPTIGLITLLLAYVKLTASFYLSWQVILMPLGLLFLFQFLQSAYVVALLQQQDPKLIKSKALWHFSSLLINSFFCLSIFYLHRVLEGDYNQLDKLKSNIQGLFGSLAIISLVYLIYSILATKDKPTVQSHGVLMNLILSIFGNTINICAGGACNSFYFSTISAFFSAFGVPIAKYLHYLNYLCVVLLGITLLSLYSVKGLKYGPFLLTLIGAILIMIDMFIYDIDYLNYLGNILVIGCAIWNSRLNKFRFGQTKVWK